MKFKNNKTAQVAARVNADDYKLLKKKKVNVSALIQDAITDAANDFRDAELIGPSVKFSTHKPESST